MILAIDIGTKTGWAYNGTFLDTGKKFITSGCENFTPKPPTKKRAAAHPGQRFTDFSDWLNEQVPLAVELIVYEHVARHVGTRAAHVYGGLLAILMDYACTQGIPIKRQAVTAIKKHATGSGRADKAAMIVAAGRIAGREITDDNEADALCLLNMELLT